MKVLFASTNPAKVKYYVEDLKSNGIEILTLKDLDINMEVIEDGANPIENAIIKARAYYAVTGVATIAMDEGLFIDGLPDEKQPKNEVRRVNNKRLNDEEMLDHYTGVVKSLGGKTTGRWIKGLAIFDGQEIITTEKKSERVFVSTISSIVHEGYPLDSITYWDQFNKYTSELTTEEWEIIQDGGIKEMLNFIKDNIICLKCK